MVAIRSSPSTLRKALICAARLFSCTTSPGQTRSISACLPTSWPGRSATPAAGRTRGHQAPPGAPSTSRRRSSGCSSKRPKRSGAAASGVLICGASSSGHGGFQLSSGVPRPPPEVTSPVASAGMQPPQKIGDRFQNVLKTSPAAMPTVTAATTHRPPLPVAPRNRHAHQPRPCRLVCRSGRCPAGGTSRAGPRAGGLVAAVPVSSIPALFWLSLERGGAYATTAVLGTLWGTGLTVLLGGELRPTGAWCGTAALAGLVAGWPSAAWRP